MYEIEMKFIVFISQIFKKILIVIKFIKYSIEVLMGLGNLRGIHTKALQWSKNECSNHN